MGSNGGTGYPVWLRCAKCRKTGRDQGQFREGLVATGRTKPLATHHRGFRSTNRRIEIRCLDCGHVGWTKHIDAETLLSRHNG